MEDFIRVVTETVGDIRNLMAELRPRYWTNTDCGRRCAEVGIISNP
ncbi:MAG: hypothetical protein ABSF48_14430 [Thermodesulfobacteriota bacterium]